MTDQEKIMDKIRALLEKTVENGASQEEAIAAGLKAQALMAKYKISEITSEEPENIDSTEADYNKQWHIELAHTLAKNLCCRTVRTHPGNKKTRFVIMGKEADRKVWQQMFETFFILIYNGAKKARQEAKERYGHARDVETAYARGFIRAIGEELGQQCRALALVVPEEVNAATKERFPHLTNCHHRATIESGATRTAYENGHADGRSAAGQKRISA